MADKKTDKLFHKALNEAKKSRKAQRDADEYTVVWRDLKDNEVQFTHIGGRGSMEVALDFWRGDMEDGNMDEDEDYVIVKVFPGHLKEYGA